MLSLYSPTPARDAWLLAQPRDQLDACAQLRWDAADARRTPRPALPDRHAARTKRLQTDTLLIWYDLETNGLEPTDAILELGAVVEAPLQPLMPPPTFQSVCALPPTQPYSLEAARIHQIDPLTIAQAPPLADVLQRFAQWIQSHLRLRGPHCRLILTAYNGTHFDHPRLQAHLPAHFPLSSHSPHPPFDHHTNHTQPAPSIVWADPLPLLRGLYDHLPSFQQPGAFRLQRLAARWTTARATAHRALDDARTLQTIMHACPENNTWWTHLGVE